MANPATTADVAARWRPLTTDEATLVGRLLDDAWEILLMRVPLLQARIDAGTLAAGLVQQVLARIVIRFMQNPDGKVSETIGEYSYTREQASRDGLLFPTDDELDLLKPAGSSSGAFTIRPVAAPSVTPLNWWELNL